MTASKVVRWNTYCIASIGKVKTGKGYCITHREVFVCCMAVDSNGIISLLGKSPVDDDDAKEQLEIAMMLFKELVEKGEIDK